MAPTIYIYIERFIYAYSRLRYTGPSTSCTVRTIFHGNPAGTSHNCPNEPKPPLPHHHGWVSAINLPYILYPSKVTWKLNLRRWDSHVSFPTSRWRLYKWFFKTICDRHPGDWKKSQASTSGAKRWGSLHLSEFSKKERFFTWVSQHGPSKLIFGYISLVCMFVLFS